MAGQATVTIRDKQWQCAVANTSQELVSGLSGVESISLGTGMLFDMGWDYPAIDIYTDEMLFPMDIIFINSVYGVVEVLRNIHPGDEAIFQAEPGARYFLEINAGEAEGIEVGDGVLIQPDEEVPAAPSWIQGLLGLAGFATMGIFMVGIVRNLTNKALEEPEEKPALLPQASPERPTSQYEIRTDRMGNIIIARSDDPGRDVFLQFESDKALVYDLLKKGEKKDLDAGWKVKIKRGEPRSSILDEMWQSSAQSQSLPQTADVNEDIGLPLPFAGAGDDRLRWLATISGRTVTVDVTGISGLSQRQLENAFAASTARISNLVVRRELPFAAATREKLWWLATIRDRTVQVEVSRIRGLSERQIEDSFTDSEAVIIATATTAKKPTRRDVSIDTWSERDRLGIWITDRRTGRTVAKWWDEDAREMFEQGWFKPGDVRHQTITGRAFEESVLEYAESVGLLAGGKYLAQTVKDACYWTAVNKDTGEITESYAPYTSSGRALRGGKAFVSRHWRGEALIEVWKEPFRYSENLKIEPVASETLILCRQKSAAVIPEHKRQPGLRGEIEFLPDSPEFLAYTIDDIGYRDKIDSAFVSAIARARGGK